MDLLYNLRDVINILKCFKLQELRTHTSFYIYRKRQIQAMKRTDIQLHETRRKSPALFYLHPLVCMHTHAPHC